MLKKKTEIDWVVHYVFDSVKGIDAHTHGINSHGHPEIRTVLNLSPKLICAILNGVGINILNGERYDKEGIYNNVLDNGIPVKVKMETIGGEECCVILFPDARMKFPGDEGCSKPYSLQLKYLEAIKKSYNE